MKSVSPYITTLSQENAYWMALMSKLVYLKESDSTKPNEDAILEVLQRDDEKFKSVKGFDKDSAQAAVIEHEDYLTIAFRGTDELGDWLDNIDAFSVQQLFGDFHRGFYNSVEDLWQEIDSRINQLKSDKKRPVFITGHSLGGAMASIAAARYVHNDIPFTSVYTFGQPRALTQATARILNGECRDRYFRFHNNNDIVTRVPARLMGYSHVGTYLYISEEGVINKDVGFWFRFVDCIDGALASLKDQGSLDAIDDHNMEDYLDHVKTWDFQD